MRLLRDPVTTHRLSGIIRCMREPDIIGSCGGHPVRAWQMNQSHTTEVHAQLAGWLVTGPFHPHWAWWAITVVHLRPLAGRSSSLKTYPQAEYEFAIVSLNPDHGQPDPEHPEKGYPFLTPPDAIVQFHGITDRDAVRILESCVRAIAAGEISPDSDYRRRWEGMIQATVKHYAAGMHLEN